MLGRRFMRKCFGKRRQPIQKAVERHQNGGLIFRKNQSTMIYSRPTSYWPLIILVGGATSPEKGQSTIDSISSPEEEKKEKTYCRGRLVLKVGGDVRYIAKANHHFIDLVKGNNLLASRNTPWWCYLPYTGPASPLPSPLSQDIFYPETPR